MKKDLMESDIMGAPSNDVVIAVHRKFEHKQVGLWRADAITIEARIRSNGMPWTLNLHPIAVSTINSQTGVVGLDCYDVYHIARWRWQDGKPVGELRKLTYKEKAVFWKLCGGDFVPLDD